MQINLPLFGKALENDSKQLIENSNKLYDELLEKEVIPEIKRESPDELSISELEEIAEKLDAEVNEYNKKIEESEIGSERKKFVRRENFLSKH